MHVTCTLGYVIQKTKRLLCLLTNSNIDFRSVRVNFLIFTSVSKCGICFLVMIAHYNVALNETAWRNECNSRFD